MPLSSCSVKFGRQDGDGNGTHSSDGQFHVVFSQSAQVQNRLVTVPDAAVPCEAHPFPLLPQDMTP